MYESVLSSNNSQRHQSIDFSKNYILFSTKDLMLGILTLYNFDPYGLGIRTLILYCGSLWYVFVLLFI